MHCGALPCLGGASTTAGTANGKCAALRGGPRGDRNDLYKIQNEHTHTVYIILCIPNR